MRLISGKNSRLLQSEAWNDRPQFFTHEVSTWTHRVSVCLSADGFGKQSGWKASHRDSENLHLGFGVIQAPHEGLDSFCSTAFVGGAHFVAKFHDRLPFFCLLALPSRFLCMKEKKGS
jgi:hypothetical protein